jgi:IS30 family transposase
MRDWKQVHVDAGIDVFLCDPRTPWQRGSNENTNGLPRQYFLKGTDFLRGDRGASSTPSPTSSTSPLKRLDFAIPTEQLLELLLH